MVKQSTKIKAPQEKDFLEFEPYRQGYHSTASNKNEQPSNPWQLGSLGYYLYTQGIKDAQAAEWENKLS